MIGRNGQPGSQRKQFSNPGSSGTRVPESTGSEKTSRPQESSASEMTHGRLPLSKEVGAKPKSRVRTDGKESNDCPQVSADVPELPRPGHSVPKTAKASKTVPNSARKRKKSSINQPEEAAEMAAKRMKREKSTGEHQPNQQETPANKSQNDSQHGAAQAMDSDQTNDSIQTRAKHAKKGTNARTDPKNGSKKLANGAIHAEEQGTKDAQDTPSAHNLLADSSQTEQPASTQPSSEQVALPVQTAPGNEGAAGDSSDDEESGVAVPVPLHPHNGQLAEQMLQDEGGEGVVVGVKAPTIAGLQSAAQMSNPADIAADLDAASASEFFMPTLADCAPGEFHLLQYEPKAEAEPPQLSDCWSSDSDAAGGVEVAVSLVPSVAKLASPSSPHSHASGPDSCKLWQAHGTEAGVAGQQTCSAAGTRQQVTATAVAEAQLPGSAERQRGPGWGPGHLEATQSPFLERPSGRQHLAPTPLTGPRPDRHQATTDSQPSLQQSAGLLPAEPRGQGSTDQAVQVGVPASSPQPAQQPEPQTQPPALGLPSSARQRLDALLTRRSRERLEAAKSSQADAQLARSGQADRLPSRTGPQAADLEDNERFASSDASHQQSPSSGISEEEAVAELQGLRRALQRLSAGQDTWQLLLLLQYVAHWQATPLLLQQSQIAAVVVPLRQHPLEAVAKLAAVIVQGWRAVMREAARREQPSAKVQAVLHDSQVALRSLPEDVRLRVAAEAAALRPLSAAVDGAASNAPGAPPHQSSPSSPEGVDGKRKSRPLMEGPSASGSHLKAVAVKPMGSKAKAASAAGADQQGQAPHNGGLFSATAQQPAGVPEANGNEIGLASSSRKPAGKNRIRGAEQPSQQPPAALSAAAAGQGGAQEQSSRKGQEWTKAEQQIYFTILKERGRDVDALMAALPGRTRKSINNFWTSRKIACQETVQGSGH